MNDHDHSDAPATNAAVAQEVSNLMEALTIMVSEIIAELLSGCLLAPDRVDRIVAAVRKRPMPPRQTVPCPQLFERPGTI